MRGRRALGLSADADTGLRAYPNRRPLSQAWGYGRPPHTVVLYLAASTGYE